MTFIYQPPRVASGDTFAGGEGSLGAIFSASVDQMLYVDNSFASQQAEEEAYDRRIGEVFRATGVKIDNPMRAMRTGRFPTRDAIRAYAERKQAFGDQVAAATRNIPDGRVRERLSRSIEGEAIAIAREADSRFGQLMESRGGLGKWIAAFGGGVAGSLRDPIAVFSLALGGGPGAGRTIAQRILATATREALVNAGAEAAMQPLVQAWRRKAGLDAGLDQALLNIGFAAAFGGALGGAGQGLGEGIVKLTGRGLRAAGEAAAAAPQIEPGVRAAANGDLAAARANLPEIRAALPAAARGALDHAETLEHLDATRPRAASAEHHDMTVSAAHRALEEPDAFSGFAADEAQIARVVEAIAGPRIEETATKAQSLVEFLKARGGILDEGGELKAIGAEALGRAPRGRGRPDRRVPLDVAREAAEEAGYIGRAGETQTTSVADLLDAIDEELRGGKIYAREDLDAVGAGTDQDAARAGLEANVAEIARHAGPAVDDRVLRAAAELSLAEGIDPLDALERAVMRADLAESGPQRSGEPLPGWSDAELEAAAAARGSEPVPAGIADPAAWPDEYAIAPGEIEEFAGLEIPAEDGRLVPLSAYVDAIAHEEGLAAIVRACRT